MKFYIQKTKHWWTDATAPMHGRNGTYMADSLPKALACQRLYSKASAVLAFEIDDLEVVGWSDAEKAVWHEKMMLYHGAEFDRLKKA